MDSDYDDEYTYGGIGIGGQNNFATNKDRNNSDDDIIDSDDDMNFIPSKKQRKNNDDNIYGVFANDSDDGGGDDNGSNSHHRRRGRTTAPTRFVKSARGGNNKGGEGLESMFVSGGTGINTSSKSSTEKMNPDVNQDNSNHDNDTIMEDGTTQSASKATNKIDNDSDDGHEKELEEERQKQKQAMEEANAKFFSVLERSSKRKKKSTTGTAAARSSKAASSVSIRSQPFFTSATKNDDKSTSTSKNNKEEEEFYDEAPQTGLGLGFRKSTPFESVTNETSSTTANKPTDTATPPPLPPSDTPSLSSFFSNSSQLQNFIGKSNKSNKNQLSASSSLSSTFIKRDPSIGKWEKHTKGIGMKLLAKMGYKGSGGLGATKKLPPQKGEGVSKSRKEEKVHLQQERKGISRPVEVVVRPANLGLGFGSFKEATKLKANQQIEAEIKGIDWEKTQVEKKKQQEEEERKRLEKEFGVGGSGSLIPSTDSLLSSGNWRKGSGSSGKKRKRKESVKRNVISYQDIIKGKNDSYKEDVILDMRGPSVTNINPSSLSEQRQQQDAAEAPTVQLGEELLHNVTFLINTYENKLHSASHFVRSSRNKANSLKSDVESLKQKRKDVQSRKTKLENVLRTIEKIEAVQDQPNIDLSQFEKLMQKLNDNFTVEEKKSLQYYAIMVPSLMSPVIEFMLKNWTPSSGQTKEYFAEVIKLCSVCSPDVDIVSLETMQRSVFLSHLIPRVKKALQSSKWNPMKNTEYGLKLYETLLDVARSCAITSQERREVSISDKNTVLLSEIDDEGDIGKSLSNMIQDSLMYDVIFPKIHHVLGQWKPISSNTDNSTEIVHPLNTWILPWLPHLDYKSMLVTLLPDVKRKIKQTLQYVSKSHDTSQNAKFFAWALDFMKKWNKILDQQTMQSITNDSLTQRLARYMNSATITPASDAPSETLGTIITLLDQNLIGDLECLSMVEGELLPKLAAWMYRTLSSRNPTVSEVAKVYVYWRKNLFISQKAARGRTELSRLGQILSNDSNVCRILYGCLLMINAANGGDKDSLDDLEPPSSIEVNYKMVQARRAKEVRLREEEEKLRGRVDKNNHVRKAQMPFYDKGGPTFKEVVEDFARHNGMMFHPKQGPNSMKDGKRVYVLGSSQIYIDTNVVFTLDGDSWKPVALEELA